MNILQNLKVCGNHLWKYVKKPSRHNDHEMCYDVFNDRQSNDKQLRIDTLLYIRQVKNTYFKYTNNSLFDPQLYNIFIGDDNFDGGDTAFDDGNETRIFDGYVIEYIRSRSCAIEHIRNNHPGVSFVDGMDALDENSALFVIDMKDKELFRYCFSIVESSLNTYKLKDIIFGLMFKRNCHYIRTNISSFDVEKNNHAYLIIENLLKK